MPLLEDVGYDQQTHDKCVQDVRNQLPLPIPEIITKIAQFYKYLYNTNPQEINYGMCEDFACDLITLTGHGEALWADEMSDYCRAQHGDHCFALIDGTYYDSECPNGTTDWKTLPFFIWNSHRKPN